MRIYSDSKVGDLLRTMDEEAGDLRIVEMGHAKTNEEANIFNYSIAYDTKNQEPLFYALRKDELIKLISKSNKKSEKSWKLGHSPLTDVIIYDNILVR